MGLHSEAKLNRKFVEFAKLMNVYLNHFPKHEKYGLALQIRTCAYDLYALIVEAQKRYHKKTTLTQLDVKHEQLRMMVNLAHDLGYFAFRSGEVAEDADRCAAKRFMAMSRMVDELGRMIGGWMRSERQAAPGEAS
jgi:hypothetical protein